MAASTPGVGKEEDASVVFEENDEKQEEPLVQDAVDEAGAKVGTVLTFRDGRRVQKNASGVEIEIWPDGTRTQRNPSGVTITRRPDGTCVQTNPATGVEIRQAADGSSTQKHADGTVVETDARGELLAQTNPDGTRIERRGEKIVQTNPDGTVLVDGEDVDPGRQEDEGDTKHTPAAVVAPPPAPQPPAPQSPAEPRIPTLLGTTTTTASAEKPVVDEPPPQKSGDIDDDDDDDEYVDVRDEEETQEEPPPPPENPSAASAALGSAAVASFDDPGNAAEDDKDKASSPTLPDAPDQFSDSLEPRSMLGWLYGKTSEARLSLRNDAPKSRVLFVLARDAPQEAGLTACDSTLDDDARGLFFSGQTNLDLRAAYSSSSSPSRIPNPTQLVLVDANAATDVLVPDPDRLTYVSALTRRADGVWRPLFTRNVCATNVAAVVVSPTHLAGLESLDRMKNNGASHHSPPPAPPSSSQ